MSDKKEFTNVPDGKYQVKIEKCEVRDFKGKEQVSMQMRILGPTQSNRVLFKNYPARDRWAEEKMAWIGKELAILGASVKRFDSTSIVGKVAEVAVLNKPYLGKVYTNVYINSEVDVGAGLSPLDEVPF
mgnify:CR=1 FL=1